MQLLSDQTGAHRDRVFVEYADNEEAMIRTERWKLIYSTGARRRRDGYALDKQTDGPLIQLFDLDNDPDELLNLAGESENLDQIGRLRMELFGHLIGTAREPLLLEGSQPMWRAMDCEMARKDTDIFALMRKVIRTDSGSG